MGHHVIDVASLASSIRAGSVRALARGLTCIEAGGSIAESLVELLYPYSRPCHVIGVTGAPGAGKSTLVNVLAQCIRQRGRQVAVLAIDPSSPFTGGAILGDRIRMADAAEGGDVFIRSMATRGALGGLSRAAADAVDVMAAAGREVVIVETVGVGQDEIDIMRLAHSTVVVSVPGLGDEIQALKAGIIEIADIHVVNKADREGADRTIADLKTMLAMDGRHVSWEPPVVRCVAAKAEGVGMLADELERHGQHLQASGEIGAREKRISEARVLKLAQSFIVDTLKPALERQDDSVARDIQRVVIRDLSPYRFARALLTRASEPQPVKAHV